VVSQKKENNSQYVEKAKKGDVKMKAKCIKTFLIEQCDDDGFLVENSDMFIYEGSEWNVEEDTFRVIGGEIRLTSAKEDDCTWLELPKANFDKCFEIIK
jgi:hypothetical protein